MAKTQLSIDPVIIWLAAPVMTPIADAPAFARRAIREGVNTLEFRADSLAGIHGMSRDEIIRMFRQIRQTAPALKLLLTPRSIREGGTSKLTDKWRRELILGALDDVDAVDVEWRSVGMRKWAIRRFADAKGKQLILSWHDFASRPTLEELDILSAEVRRDAPEALLKIATVTRTKSDVLDLLRWTMRQARQVPKVVKNASNSAPEPPPSPQIATPKIALLSMGEAGKAGRLALALAGSRLAFAALGETSAPGQIEARVFAAAFKAAHDEFCGQTPCKINARKLLDFCNKALAGSKPATQ